MTVDPPRTHRAVITGAFVRSKQLTSEEFENAQAAIRQGGARMRELFAAEVPLPLEVFRGDSWQILVTDPARALRIALYLRAFLCAEAGVDTRFAIGVGPVDAIPKNSVGQGRGEAFRLSGAMLDWKVATHMRFSVAGLVAENARDPIHIGEETVDEILVRAISATLLILDLIARNWTRAQGRAVCGALLEWTQEKIAESWPGESITQQAVAQHLSRAGWDGVRETVALYEDTARRWA
jgi:hypothetical protein